MTERLEDKSILIIGGTKGVGRGVAERCAIEGARLVIAGRDEAVAEEIIGKYDGRVPYRPVYIHMDVTDLDEIEEGVAKVEELNGRIDGLFYYSGILPVATLNDTDETIFDRVMDINVKGAFFVCKAVVHSMLKTGGGSIVLNGSAHGYGGEEDRAAYAVSKGALITLMKHISKNYAKYNIRANWITMGWVATPGELELRASQGHDLKWLEKEAAERTPIGRLLTVEEHVPGVVYLLSDESAVVTCTELNITGGFST